VKQQQTHPSALGRAVLARGVACLIGLVLVAHAPIASGVQSTGQAEMLLRQAIHAEVSDGDLEAAIELYREVVARFPEVRTVAAKALLQMGKCYEKLGDAQAREAYERLVRDYADQGETAAKAGSRLAALDARDARGVAPRGVNGDAEVETSRERLLPEISTAGGTYAEFLQLSPDGRRAIFLGISFGNPLPGGQNIGVYDYESRATTWLTDHDWERLAAPMGVSGVWSADGRQVAYSTYTYNRGEPGVEVAEIWVAPPDEPARVVFQAEESEAYVTDWLRDGSALVVALQRAGQALAIGLVSLEDGSFRQLKTLEWAAPTAPKASPDGRHIVFEDGTRDSRDLFLLATDGSSVVPLDEHPALDQQPLWSPDGKHVVFRSNRQGKEAVWGIAVEDGRPSGRPFLVKDQADGVNLVNWAANGVAYHRSATLSDIYTAAIDLESGEAKTAAKMIPYPNTGSNFRPRWSPDGRFMAFLRGKLSGGTAKRTLVVLPLDGGRPLEFLPPEEAFYLISYIRWKPDGSELSVTSRDRQRCPIVLRLSLPDGRWHVEPLPPDLWGYSMDWAPSWKSFFYYRPPPESGGQGPCHSDSGAAGLFESHADTGEPKLLWSPPVHPIRAMTTSPDGQRIAFTILARIWIFDRSSGEARQIPDVAAVPYLSWSPDGRYLLYAGTDEPGVDSAEHSIWEGGGSRLRLLDVGTGVSKELHVGEELLAAAGRAASGDATLATPAWSHDGQRIAFGIQATSFQTRFLEDPLAGTAAESGSGRRQR